MLRLRKQVGTVVIFHHLCIPRASALDQNPNHEEAEARVEEGKIVNEVPLKANAVVVKGVLEMQKVERRRGAHGAQVGRGLAPVTQVGGAGVDQQKGSDPLLGIGLVQNQEDDVMQKKTLTHHQLRRMQMQGDSLSKCLMHTYDMWTSFFIPLEQGNLLVYG